MEFILFVPVHCAAVSQPDVCLVLQAKLNGQDTVHIHRI